MERPPASAAINSPYFTFNPGDPFKAWDTSVTFDYMPKQWITFRFEGDYRHANVPYWSGREESRRLLPGRTPGTNNGIPTQYACMDGSSSGETDADTVQLCANNGGVWYPGSSQAGDPFRHRSDGEILTCPKERPRGPAVRAFVLVREGKIVLKRTKSVFFVLGYCIASWRLAHS